MNEDQPTSSEREHHQISNNNEVTEDDSIDKYVNDINFVDLDAIQWYNNNNKRHLDKAGDDILHKRPHLAVDADIIHTDLQDIDISQNSDYLLREALPSVSIPAPPMQHSEPPALGSSLRFKNFHEVLPKFSQLTKQSLYSHKVNSNVIKQLQLRKPRTLDTFVNESITELNSMIPDAKSNNKYSQDEDVIIANFVQKYCQYEGNTQEEFNSMVWSSKGSNHSLMDFWKSLYKIFNYRSRTSLYNHVRRKYHNFNKYGTWDSQDDANLSKLCNDETLEGQWSNIGQMMNRMPDDCRDRWRNYLKLGSKQQMNKWSLEEETELENTIKDITNNQKLKIDWGVISERMKTKRSRLQCRYKWGQLCNRNAIKIIKSLSNERLLFIFTKLKQIIQQDIDAKEINWDQFANSIKDNDKIWTSSELLLCYNEWRTQVDSYRKKSPLEIVNDIINSLQHERE